MRPTAFVTCTPGPHGRRTAAVALRSALMGRPLAHAAPSRRAVLHIHPRAMADADADAESAPEAPAPPAEAVAPEQPDPAATAAAAAPAAPAEPEVTPAAEGDAVAAQAAADGDRPAGERRRRRRTRAKRAVTLPLEDLKEGMELEGVVKSVMAYGAFIGDMGTPTDGLLHVSQLTTGYVENVSDVVKEGEKVKVRVMAVDIEKGTFSLTMKTPEQVEEQRAASQAARDARAESRADASNRRQEKKKRWDEFTFDPEVFVPAKVTSLTDFGAFCQLLNAENEPLETAPTDGLIHISEFSNERVAKVTDVVSLEQVVQVRVVTIDRKRNRISLSMREFGSDSRKDNAESANLAEDMASAQANQPEFKTAMELAFEKAQAKKAAKEAAMAK